MIKDKYAYCCYPFLTDDKWATDYEVLTDGLSSEIGFASAINKNNKWIKNDLIMLVKNVLDLNPLARHPNETISKDVKKTIEKLYEKYNCKYNFFVLPIGGLEAASISRLRMPCKIIIRLIIKHDKSQQDLLDCFNMMANIFHMMYLKVTNKLVKFVTRTY